MSTEKNTFPNLNFSKKVVDSNALTVIFNGVMKINVEQCWNGASVYFRLTFNGRRETVIAERWNRKVATLAKNLLERVYHLNRRNIVFVHR